MAVMYVVTLSVGHPVAIAIVNTIIVAGIATLVAMCATARSTFSSAGVVFPAALAAMSAAFAAFIATTATTAGMFTMTSPVMPFFVLLVVAALAVATIGATKTKKAKSSTILLVVHDVLWTGAIGTAIYFGATLYGAVAAIIAIALPLVFLKYETRKDPTEEEVPLGI